MKKIEASNLMADTIFLFNLMMQLHALGSVPILIFNLVPFLSFYTVESQKWLVKQLGKGAKSISIEHREIIETSRNRLKFFDSGDKNINEKLFFLDYIIEAQYYQFNYKHRGILGWLKKLLQADLGLTLHNGSINSTTFTNLINLGYSKAQLDLPPTDFFKIIGEKSKSVGKSFGEYVKSMSIRIGSTRTTNFFNSLILDRKNFKYYDVKSKNFLNEIFPTIKNQAICLYLLYFLSSLNFLLTLEKAMINKENVTFFKMKFITLFHIALSIRKLSNFAYPTSLIDRVAVEKLNFIVKQPDVTLLLRNSKFRNNMVHYEIRNIPEKEINYRSKLWGLVEYFFSGMSYEELNYVLNKSILHVSKEITDLMNWAPVTWKIQSFE